MTTKVDGNISSIYPQLPLPALNGSHQTAARTDDLASRLFPEPSAPPMPSSYQFPEPSAPLLSHEIEGAGPPAYVEADAPPPYPTPNQYVPVSQYVPIDRTDVNHIDYQNPLTRLGEEPGEPLADQIAAGAGRAADALANAAPDILRAARTVAVPAAGLAWSAIKGAGGLVWDAVASAPQEDPVVTMRRQELEKKLERLEGRRNQLAYEQWELDRRETGMVLLPAVTGWLFGGVVGLITGVVLSKMAQNVVRSTSRAFDLYRAKAEQSAQINAEIRSISYLLGRREPILPRLFN